MAGEDRTDSPRAARPLGDATRALKALPYPTEPGQPLQPGPVFAAPYLLSADEGSESDFYARNSHPGWRVLEDALATLERAQSALVFSSGMAAITTVLASLLKPGDHLVIPSDGYYQVRAWAAQTQVPNGVHVAEFATVEMVAGVASLNIESSGAAPRLVVLAETPSNPGLEVVDLRKLAATVHAKGEAAILAVDNTTPTPFGQLPLDLGADLVLASGTKSLAGHSDLLYGYAAGAPELLAPAAARRTQLGTTLGPFEAWLAVRSLETAGLRFTRQCENALAVAAMLVSHPLPTDVRYPGLPQDASYPTAVTQMRQFGALVSFTLPAAAMVHRVAELSDLLLPATSFGGLHSTIDRRARWGDQVPEGFVRLSCGIEDTADVVNDLNGVLDRL